MDPLRSHLCFYSHSVMSRYLDLGLVIRMHRRPVGILDRS